MTEFQEFPKMIYHPKTKAQVIVANADQEAEQLEAWGVEEPKIPLRSSAALSNDGDSKPKAAPKPRARKPKAS